MQLTLKSMWLKRLQKRGFKVQEIFLEENDCLKLITVIITLTIIIILLKNTPGWVSTRGNFKMWK